MAEGQATDNINAWIKNDSSIAAYSQGTCNFNLNNGITNGERKRTTYHYNTDTPLPNQTLGLGFGMDYAICGAGNEVGRNSGGHDACAFYSEIEFKNIMENCIPNNNPENEDPCINMAIDGDFVYEDSSTDNHGKPASSFCSGGNCHGRSGFVTDGLDGDDDTFKFIPSTCKWNDNDEDGPNHNNCWQKQHSGWFRGNLDNESNKHTGTPSPALPVNLKKIATYDQSDVGFKLYSQHNSPMDCNDINQQLGGGNAPYTFDWDQYKCAGHGNPGHGIQGNDPDQDLPACGTGEDLLNDQGVNTEIVRLNGNWSVCKRSSNDYDLDNILECCINDKGLSWENGKGQCPSKYCVTKMPYEDASAADTCTPILDGDEQYCFQMSNDCQEKFDPNVGGICTSEVFSTIPTTEKERKRNTACKKWARIFPEKFNTLAETLCDPDRILEESVYDDYQTLAQNDTEKLERVIELFESSLCRNYFEDNIGLYGPKLRNMCGEGITVVRDGEGDETSWIKTGNYDKLINICPCYLPDEYYEWWKNENLFNDENVRSNIENIGTYQPACYHPDCIKSLLFDKEAISGNCPNVEVCIQEINKNIQVGDDHLSSLRPPASINDLQVCNFNSISGQQDNEQMLIDGQTVEGSEATQYNEALNSLVENNVEDMSSYFDNEENGLGEDTLMIIGIGLFGIIMLLMVLFMVSGNTRQRIIRRVNNPQMQVPQMY